MQERGYKKGCKRELFPGACWGQWGPTQSIHTEQCVLDSQGPKATDFWVDRTFTEDLRVPWTARRSDQSILREISPEYSLEGLMLKLKLQYFGHLMRKTDSFEKTQMLGKIEDKRRRGQQRMRWLDGITDSMDMSLSSSGSWWWTGRPGVLQSTGLQRVRHDWATELSDWFLYNFIYFSKVIVFFPCFIPNFSNLRLLPPLINITKIVLFVDLFK